MNDRTPPNDSEPACPIGTAHCRGAPQVGKRRKNQSNLAVDLLETAHRSLTALVAAHIPSGSRCDTSPALNDITVRSEQVPRRKRDSGSGFAFPSKRVAWFSCVGERLKAGLKRERQDV